MEQTHLGVGTVIGDHAGLVLLQHVRLHDHRECIGSDLVPDGRRDEYLDLGVKSGDADRSCRGRVGGPVGARDAQRLELVLSGECQVADLDVLEQGEL